MDLSRITPEEAVDLLKASAPVALTSAPNNAGIYTLRDHLGAIRYVGITRAKGGGLRDRWSKHVSGSSGRSHVYSQAYNSGRMWQALSDTSADGKIAKRLRTLFVRRHCFGTFVAFPDLPDTEVAWTGLCALERGVQEVAPWQLSWLGARTFDPVPEPRDLVDALLVDLDWPRSLVEAVERQALLFQRSSEGA